MHPSIFTPRKGALSLPTTHQHGLLLPLCLPYAGQAWVESDNLLLPLSGLGGLLCIISNIDNLLLVF